MFCVFLAKCLLRRWWAFSLIPIIWLELLNLGHSSVNVFDSQLFVTEFTDGLHFSWGASVKRECPIRILVITTSSCLDEGEGHFREAIDVLISLSLFVLGIFSHMSCQWILVVKLLICIVRWCYCFVGFPIS